tara:strand:+ start:8957 stop:11311 length:2355 start_codon:yes stop_codon:yes gene_type:complete
MADDIRPITPEDMANKEKWLRLATQTLNVQERALAKLKEQRIAGDITIEQYDKQIQLQQDFLSLSKEEIASLLKEIKLRKLKIDLLKQEAALFDDSIKDLDSYTGKITKALGLSGQLSDTFSGGWVNAGFALVGFAKKLKAANAEVDSTAVKLKMAQKAAMGLSKAGDAFAGAFIGRFESVVKDADKMRSEFYKNTQASEEMGAVMVGVSEKLQHMGLDFGQAGEAVQKLRQNSTAFKHANEDMQKSMAVTVGVLQQAGVSGETSVKTFDVLTKVLGRDIPSATKSLAKFGSIAESLDMSMEDFSKSFVDASKKLAYNGPKMEKVFIGLQSQAYATGVSMSSLLDIAGQFDTFEGSAQAVSKLNGILGGPYLNSIEMVYMSEEKRIEAMRDSITMSGKQWSSMSKFEKMAVMSAAGVKDLEEANRLFGTSTEEYEKAEAKAKAAAEQQKKFEETALKATQITEKFKHAMNGLVIAFGPALNMVVDLVEGFSNWVKNLSELEKKWVFFGAIFLGLGAKIVGMWIAMAFQAKLAAIAAGEAGIATAAAGKTGAGGLGMLKTGWIILKHVMTGLGSMIVGIGSSIATMAGSAVTALGAITAPVWGLIALVVIAGTAIWYFWDEIKAGFTAGWAWVKKGWDTFVGYLSFDNVVDAVADTFQDIADFLPGSAVKVGPLMHLEEKGAAISEQLSKGVAKGVKVKIVPQMEKVAEDQLSFHEKFAPAHIIDGGSSYAEGAKDTTKTALTPTRTQTQSQRPVQLVIDYKGVKRLLGEIQGELLEDNIGLRLA